MKLRCRLAAMIFCASGSIHVVTNVARLCAGSPSIARSSNTSRIASAAGIPPSGNWRLGTSWVTKRLPNRAASALALDGMIMALLGSGVATQALDADQGFGYALAAGSVASLRTDRLQAGN